MLSLLRGSEKEEEEIMSSICGNRLGSSVVNVENV